MRRICLFAGFDGKNQIHDYVVYFIKKLSELSDVYYVGNGHFGPEELYKIAPYTKMFYTDIQPHRDFGSWKFLIENIGWKKLAEYDELILCNDSVYGPLYELNEAFFTMERKGYDFWSITADREKYYHLHNYFMVFGNDIIKNESFHQFWQAVPFYSNVKSLSYELTPLLTNQGFVCNSYIRAFSTANLLEVPEKMLDKYPAPFIKIKSFLPENRYTSGNGFALRSRIKLRSDYDTKLINNHIKQAELPQTWQQTFARLAGL